MTGIIRKLFKVILPKKRLLQIALIEGHVLKFTFSSWICRFRRILYGTCMGQSSCVRFRHRVLSHVASWWLRTLCWVVSLENSHRVLDTWQIGPMGYRKLWTLDPWGFGHLKHITCGILETWTPCCVRLLEVSKTTRIPCPKCPQPHGSHVPYAKYLTGPMSQVCFWDVWLGSRTSGLFKIQHEITIFCVFIHQYKRVARLIARSL